MPPPPDRFWVWEAGSAAKARPEAAPAGTNPADRASDSAKAHVTLPNREVRFLHIFLSLYSSASHFPIGRVSRVARTPKGAACPAS